MTKKPTGLLVLGPFVLSGFAFGQATDAKARIASWEKHVRLKNESPFRDLAWRPVGPTWTSISGNLPSEPVKVIKEDPKKPQILYVGTDLGAYVSLDRGKTWSSLCNHLPTCAVVDLAIQPRDGELVAGTHGRSIFVLDIKPIQAKLDEPNPVSGPNDGLKGTDHLAK